MRGPPNFSGDLSDSQENDDQTTASNFNTVRSPASSAVPSSLRALFEDVNSPAPRQDAMALQTPFSFPTSITYATPQEDGSPDFENPPITISSADEEAPSVIETSQDEEEGSLVGDTFNDREPTLNPVPLPTPFTDIVPSGRGATSGLSGFADDVSSLVRTESPPPGTQSSRPHASPTHQSAYSLDFSPTTAKDEAAALSPPPIMRTRSATTLTTTLSNPSGPLNLSLQASNARAVTDLTRQHNKGVPSRSNTNGSIEGNSLFDPLTSRGTPGLKDVLKVCIAFINLFNSLLILLH